MKEEKKCTNCKYFMRHFINLYGRFMPLLTGHCINREVPRRISEKLIAKFQVCEKWEPMRLQTEERRGHIVQILLSMAENVSDIAQILLSMAENVSDIAQILNEDANIK